MRVSSATFFTWLVGFALFSPVGHGDPAPANAAPRPPRKLRLAFVTNNAADYWTVAGAGVERAGRELGVSARMVMPATGTADEQSHILAGLLSATDGLAISPVDPSGQIPDLNRAAAKTLLFTQVTDAPLSKRACFVGSDNVAAGRQIGEQLKRVLPWGGGVMVFAGKRDASNVVERIRGLEDALKGSNLRILDVRIDDTDRAKAKANVADALAKTPGLAGCVGIWSYNGPAILSAVRDAKKLGKVKIVCFDEEEDTLDGIKRGQISAAIVQQPEQIGYLSILMMAKVLRGDKTAIPANRRVMVPTLIVTQNNLDASRTELDRLRKSAP